jgi:hypothetical protein
MQEIDKVRLDILTRGLAEAQAKLDETTHEYNLIKNMLTEIMETEQVKTHEVQDGGKIYRATFLQAVVPVIDEEGLKKELGAEFDTYTKKVLDKKALESAMEVGEVDPSRVGKYVTERKNKPSVRFTVRAADSPP